MEGFGIKVGIYSQLNEYMNILEQYRTDDPWCSM